MLKFKTLLYRPTFVGCILAWFSSAFLTRHFVTSKDGNNPIEIGHVLGTWESCCTLKINASFRFSYKSQISRTVLQLPQISHIHLMHLSPAPFWTNIVLQVGCVSLKYWSFNCHFPCVEWYFVAIWCDKKSITVVCVMYLVRLCSSVTVG